LMVLAIVRNALTIHEPGAYAPATMVKPGARGFWTGFRLASRCGEATLKLLDNKSVLVYNEYRVE